MLKWGVKKILAIIFCASFLGIILGVSFIYFVLAPKNSSPAIINPLSQKREIIGFLPYWLLDKAGNDYSKYITTLTYFGLRVDENGNIQKLLTPSEEEPGWNALHSGKLDSFFSNAKTNNVKLSLLIASGSVDAINQLVDSPVDHAKNLASELNPLVKQYGFSDINIDIENTQTASIGARENFTKFIKEVKNNLAKDVTVTVEISPTDVIRNSLIDPKAVAKIADNVVIMTYDYHSTDSFVTGPVAPLDGAGISSEYDVTAATEKALESMPSEKLILGVPLYGYEWESIDKNPRSAIIPGSGVVASSKRAENLLSSCPSCTVSLDKDAQEQYISYFDSTSDTYHTIFYPDKNSIDAKINFANKMQLSGIALWALGYEDATMLGPLESYKAE